MQKTSQKKQNSRALGLLLLSISACSSTSVHDGANDTHLQLGVRYLSLNKLEKAKDNLAMALNDNKSNPYVHNALAFLYEKLNQPDSAKLHYERAMSLMPDNFDVKNNYGRFLCDHGETDAGMELLLAASTDMLNDKQFMALTNAGRCQLVTGNKKQAELYFKKALEQNESYGPALLEMQKIAFQENNFWGAKGYLQRFVDTSAYTPEALLIASKTELALHNNDLATEYRNLLARKFPLSAEAKAAESLVLQK